MSCVYAIAPVSAPELVIFPKCQSVANITYSRKYLYRVYRQSNFAGRFLAKCARLASRWRNSLLLLGVHHAGEHVAWIAESEESAAK